MNNKKLTRSSTDRVVGGVAAGIAEYFNIDPILVRLLFVILALNGGSGLLIYFIMWLVLPEKGLEQNDWQANVNNNGKDIEAKMKEMGKDLETKLKDYQPQLWIGGLFIILGIGLSLSSFGIIPNLNLWPLMGALFMVVVGIIIIKNAK